MAVPYTKREAKSWAQKNLLGFHDAPLTPFTKDGKIDEAGIRSNVERFIDMGLDGIVVGGFIAEAWNLKLSDWLRYSEIYADAVKGRIKLSTIILDPSVHQAIEKVNFCEKLGYDAAEIMNPSVQLKTDDEIFSFYKYINDHTNLAVILYRTPVSGTVLSMDLMERLSNLDLLVGVKQGSLKRADSLKLRRDIRDDFFISDPPEYNYYEDLRLGYPISSWAAFHYTVYGNKRKVIKEYIQAAGKGDWETVHAKWTGLRDVNAFVDNLTIWEVAKTFTYASAFSILKPWYDNIGLVGGHTLAPIQDVSAERREWLTGKMKSLGIC